MTAFDEAMLADLREWRRRIEERGATPPDVVSLTMPELDALLEAVAERDVLKREACATPDEAPANVTPIRTVHYFGAARVVPVDLATLVDARVEEDERVIAWDAIAAHPFFRDCYGTEGSLLDAMLAKLTASTFTAEIPAEIRARAAALPAGHALVGGVVVPLPAEPRPAGSTALGIPYERPRLRDVVADALGEGACSCYESVPKQVERIALAIEREIAAGGIS